MSTKRRLSLPLAALAIAAVFGCTQGDLSTEPQVPAAPQFLFDGARGWLGLTLLQCDPLPAQLVRQKVGPRGGVIKVGPHRLAIPPGALRETVEITAVAPSDPVNSVKFGPKELRFAKRAWLTLSYANCQGVWLSKRIVYTDELLSILEILPSFDESGKHTVTAPVEHFSRYAVAW